MNILLAEDDAMTNLLLRSLLTNWGYSVTSAEDGVAAWNILCQPEHPHLVVLDWMMPGIEGPEIVRRLRLREPESPYYAIILTSHSTRDSAANALDIGADDFIRKPFEYEELRARVAVGFRMNALQQSLADHVVDLRQTLERVKQLEGIIPICMYCKKIRDDLDGWNQLEQYISAHSEAKFSHGVCPHCLDEQMKLFRTMTPLSA